MLRYLKKRNGSRRLGESTARMVYEDRIPNGMDYGLGWRGQVELAFFA